VTLKTFSWLVVVVAVAVASIGWFGLAGWLGLLVAALCVVAHVAGNAIGTGLRDETDRELASRPRPPQAIPLPKPPAFLERGGSLGRLVPVSVCIGGVCGGIAGGVSLAVFVGSSTAGAVLGSLSSAVIGGIGGFLVASLVEILRTTFREAIAHEQAAVARGDRGLGR